MGKVPVSRICWSILTVKWGNVFIGHFSSHQSLQSCPPKHDINKLHKIWSCKDLMHFFLCWGGSKYVECKMRSSVGTRLSLHSTSEEVCEQPFLLPRICFQEVTKLSFLSAYREPRPQSSRLMGSHTIRPNTVIHKIKFCSKMIMNFVKVHRWDVIYKLSSGIWNWGTGFDSARMG